MFRTAKHILFFSALALLMAGCLGARQKEPATAYYTLEYDPPALKSAPSLEAVVQVQRFQVSPLYNSTKIVFQEKMFERDAYNYHRWRANPAELVPYFLARDLEQSSLFKAVFVFDRRYPSTHAIEGIVEEFHELDSDNSWHAALSVSITLMRPKEPDISQRILFQKKYRTQIPCREKTPKALIESMSRAMQQVSKRIITDVYRTIADRSEIHRSISSQPQRSSPAIFPHLLLASAQSRPMQKRAQKMLELNDDLIYKTLKANGGDYIRKGKLKALYFNGTTYRNFSIQIVRGQYLVITTPDGTFSLKVVR